MGKLYFVYLYVLFEKKKKSMQKENEWKNQENWRESKKCDKMPRFPVLSSETALIVYEV